MLLCSPRNSVPSCAVIVQVAQPAVVLAARVPPKQEVEVEVVEPRRVVPAKPPGQGQPLGPVVGRATLPLHRRPQALEALAVGRLRHQLRRPCGPTVRTGSWVS